jgi:peptidoglycan-associated lipoprotein
MHRIIVPLLVAMLALGGCSLKHPKPSSTAGSPVGAAGAQGAGATDATAAAVGAGGSSNPDDEIAGPQAGLLATRIVYFDFDSNEIKGEAADVVAAHAKYLATNAGARVRLEGHTDERGSGEYNIGLGERRAQAVRHALLLQGVREDQVSTVSYGEERPAVPGHDEAAWAKNRRVEIVYLVSATGAPKQ